MSDLNRGIRRVAQAAYSRRERLRQLVPFLSLALVIAAFSTAPNFISVSNLENILRQLPVLLIVATGATFPILIGSIDLSVAATMTLSGSVAAVLTAHFGEKALLFAPLVGLLVGLVNGFIVAKIRLPSFLVTLGTFFVIGGLADIVTGGVPHPYVGSVSDKITTETVSIGSLDVTYLTVLSLTGVIIISILTVRTRPGRYFYAIGGGEVVARLSGVKVDRYKILVFGLSGTLAGVAGLALTMRASAATPQMGDPFLLTSVAAVVVGGTALLGGIGGPHWTILGALVIITLDDGMIIANVNPDYQTVIRGLVIILASALTLRRQGQVVIK